MDQVPHLRRPDHPDLTGAAELDVQQQSATALGLLPPPGRRPPARGQSLAGPMHEGGSGVGTATRGDAATRFLPLLIFLPST
jgi:hypothetical protein